MDETGAGSTGRGLYLKPATAMSPPEWRKGGDPPFLMAYDFSNFRNN
jgi:hypothetical protein